MPKSNESINRELFDLLSTRGYRPTMLDTSGKEIPVPEEAEVFQFNFVKDEVDYGIVTISIDGLHKLVIYFNDKIADSEKETSDNDDVSWYRLLNHLKRFAKNRQLSFQVKNTDHLKHDMAKRDHMKKLDEGYYPMGKNKSYSDAVPQVKIVIEHTRNIVEGEQRYRNVARIFVENADGERFLIPTTKPGIARVYARHIAEGGTPYDDRANHITSLVEDYNKMSGFVRATRNGQFNESAQRLVLEGVGHYTKLRETLSHMAGRRGYTAYFENWTPSLMEDETEETNLNELFVQETLDPRIESVLPILSKLNKKISEMSEVTELAEWADSLLEGGDGGEASEEPPESKEGETAEDGNEAPEDNLDESMDPEKRSRLDDLIGMYRDSTDPSDYYDSEYEDPEEVLNMIRAEFGDRVASQVEAGTDKMHFPRKDHDQGYDPMSWRKPIDRQTKAGKMYKQDSDYRKNTIKARFNNRGSSAIEGVEEGILDTVKKVGGKVLDKLGHGSDEDLLKDLKDKAGVRNPQTGKPSMAYSDVEKRTDEVDMGQADSSLRNEPKQDNGKMDHFTALGKASKKMGHDHYMDVPDDKLEALRAMVKRFRAGEEVDESALQAYLGDKKYGKDGMKKLRKAGQEDASEKTMQNIRAEYSSKEEPVTEDEFAGDYATGEAGQWRNKGPKANKPATIGDLVGEGQEDLNTIKRLLGK
jgi:hypothetical protein